MNAQFFRKSHDYRPFLYNDTVDVCGFLKKQNQYKFWKRIYSFVLPYTNANHSCPYNVRENYMDL